MSNPGYLAIIKRHEAFRPALGGLTASIATGIVSPALVDDASRLPCITVIVHIAHTQGAMARTPIIGCSASILPKR